MSQVTEQSVRFQTALASIKLIQASAVLDLTEDDFDFLTSNKVWIATDRSRARRCVEACVYGTLDRSEERFSRNAETDLVCRLLLEKKNGVQKVTGAAKYAYEYPVDHVTYVFPVQSTIAKGRNGSIDTSCS